MTVIHVHTAIPVDLHAVAQATASALFGLLDSPCGNSDLGCSASQASDGVVTECMTEFDSHWNLFRPLVAVRGRRLDENGEREYCDDERVNCVVIAPQQFESLDWGLSAAHVARVFKDVACAMGAGVDMTDDQSDVCDG